MRASTPSNAAQILFPDKHEFLARVQSEVSSVVSVIDNQIEVRINTMKQQAEELLEVWQRRVEENLAKIRSQQQTIVEYDPEIVLRRGYAVIQGERSIGSIVNITTSKEIMEAEVIRYDKR